MMEKLEQLRAKPDRTKRMISASVAGGITLVIIIFWIASLSISAGNSDQNVDAASASIAVSPFSALSASVEDAFAPIGAAFSSLFDSLTGKQTSSSDAIQLYSSASTSSDMNTVNQ
jgi:hypothetical protein